MMIYQVNGLGDEISYDEQKMMFAEGLELEAQTGMGATKYLSELNDGSTRSTAALLWLGAVKHAATRDGIPFRDAARALPFAAFTENLDLVATMKTVRRPPAMAEPQDPTQTAPDGSAAPTSPATSEPLPAATLSPAAETATSEPSPNSSASAPGSGTA